MADRRDRVAQWGTGNVGLYALRTVIEHPRFDPVGPWVDADAKVGRDAAVPYVCDAAPGILQTDDLPPIIGKFA